ncbi:polysaccharide biosynthesis/export family protein [Adhaeribacter radiodurans]|uniref:Polysaccharide biosynthesis/export family protein n=1 Tax=Adhaeribacter radiodurans TaxID=2745197 RepID=A0A7L7L3M3_9BACT|nr:polysaccharide biosynthesis/export family protein [Adhaeribacter radiodurans]QMU27421.1 polysaccharide biosynthesis/export family protein [Adhaeribacter radiodurans]
MRFGFVYVLIVTVFISCKPSLNLIYFRDLKDLEYTTKIGNRTKPHIQSDDLLGITVSTLSPESNALFNNGVIQSTVKTALVSKDNNEGYLVDENGFINFPVLGLIQVGGLTKEEATQKLTSAIEKFVRKPIVNIRFIDFKISVIGEVNRPSNYTVPTEKINIFQAIALAGDLTPYGKRNNIAIIRENEGVRKVVRINLNNKEVLNSPYFYLQQNDVVYVEPNKSKAAQASLSRSNVQFGVSVALSILSILTVLVRI